MIKFIDAIFTLCYIIIWYIFLIPVIFLFKKLIKFGKMFLEMISDRFLSE